MPAVDGVERAMNAAAPATIADTAPMAKYFMGVSPRGLPRGPCLNARAKSGRCETACGLDDWPRGIIFARRRIVLACLTWAAVRWITGVVRGTLRAWRAVAVRVILQRFEGAGDEHVVVSVRIGVALVLA